MPDLLINSWVFPTTFMAVVFGLTALFSPALNGAALVRSIRRDRRRKRPYYNRVRVARYLVGSTAISLLGFVWALGGFGSLLTRQSFESNVEIVTLRDGREVGRAPTQAPALALRLFEVLVGIAGSVMLVWGVRGLGATIFRRRDAGALSVADYVWLSGYYSRGGKREELADIVSKGIALVQTEIARQLQGVEDATTKMTNSNTSDNREAREAATKHLLKLREQEAALRGFLKDQAAVATDHAV